MRVTVEGLQAGLRAFMRDEHEAVASLRRAIDAAGGLPPGRTLEQVLEVALLAAAQAHERRTEGIATRMRDALARVLDDVDATRGTSPTGPRPAGVRPTEARVADQRAIAGALDDLETFDAFVRRTAGTAGDSADDVAHAVDDLVLTDPGAALRRAASRGASTVQDAEQILAAWARGLTVEAEGGWRHVTNPGDPALAATMRRLQAAVDAYHARPGTDAASAIAAAERLRRMTSQAGEELRAAASDFSATRAGEILVPNRPPEPGRVLGPELQRGLDAAVAARERVRARPDLATTAPAADVFTALEVATPGYRAEGTTRQPLGRTTRGVGLERAFLRPSEIGALRSETPGLAARLASLMRDWERAHMVGPGFGSELFEGLALAPWGVNHQAQNDGIEAVIRALHESGADPQAVVQANTRTLVVPLVGGGFQEFDVLSSVRYDVTAPGHGTFFFDVQVRPDGSWNVTHNVPPALAPPGGFILAGAR